MSEVSVREVIQGLQEQGIVEEIAYTLDVTPWGVTPSVDDISMVVYDETADFGDVTSTVTAGSMAVAGMIITTKVIRGLTVNHTYRVVVDWGPANSVRSGYFRIKAAY